MAALIWLRLVSIAAEKILATAAGLAGGPELKQLLSPDACNIIARGHGYEPTQDKSPALIVSGIRKGYTVRISSLIKRALATSP